MHQPYLARRFAHACGEVDQAALVGVGGVAAEGGDACFYMDAFAVEVDVAAFGAVLLDDLPGVPLAW